MKKKNCKINDEAVTAIARYFFELFKKNPALARQLEKEHGGKKPRAVATYKAL